MAMSRNRERTNSRAVIYSRLSPRIRPDGSESCEKQIEICQGYCDFCKLEVIGVFYDKNTSGAKAANRPGLQLKGLLLRGTSGESHAAGTEIKANLSLRGMDTPQGQIVDSTSVKHLWGLFCEIL